jgi:hypothetical protein
MNEIELIRAQLAAERSHAGAVAGACAVALERAEPGVPTSGSPLAEFRQACVEYLVCVLAWFEERDQRLADLWHTRLAPGDPERRSLDDLLGGHGRSREALERLAAALESAGHGPRQSWQEFATFFNGVWSARRAALDALMEPLARTADWRQVAGIDADSILEERARYARVRATLPAGAAPLSPPGLSP